MTVMRVRNKRRALVAGLACCLLLLSGATSFAAECLIVGDIQYKPIAEVVSVIKHALPGSPKVYATADAKGKLAAIVERQGASLVVALGKDALDEALKLPASIAVVYGLVLVPPQSSRTNMTGIYMSTPAVEYINAARKYLPGLKRLTLIGSRNMLRILDGKYYWQVASYQVGNMTQLFKAVSDLDDFHAIVLLPDADFMNPAVLERMQLLAYRRNVPLLGISEGNVRQGALFALVFDPAATGRQIAERAGSVLNGTDPDALPPSPPKRFNLFVNTTTAKKVGVTIPDEMMQVAKRIYR